LNAIFAFIGTTSLTDDELAIATSAGASLFYDADTYKGALAVLDSREAVSVVRDRLRYFFLAKGVAVGALPEQSNIYFGGVLE
jgi:hypothetical protein